jgi:hypothetical protein
MLEKGWQRLYTTNRLQGFAMSLKALFKFERQLFFAYPDLLPPLLLVPTADFEDNSGAL